MRPRSALRSGFPLACLLAVVLGAADARPARAADRLCDSSFEDCRSVLVDLIRRETSRIDVAFWFMSDGRYADELISRWRAGVDVRIIVDPRANEAHSGNAAVLLKLKNAGIPMRQKSGGGILHWKLMLFDALNTVEFGGANYSFYTFAPVDPYRDYEDEVIFFADGLESPAIVDTFRTRYEDNWLETSRYTNYANVTAPLVRHYPINAKDPDLNFPPFESYRNRAIAAYDGEHTKIDVSMFRITDRTHTDAMIRAILRGVAVRLLTDTTEYRNPDRLWDSWNVDRIYMAGLAARAGGLPGADIRLDAHSNVMHQKSIVLYDTQTTIFGSSNWTSPSAGGSSGSQEEHNYFTTRVPFFNWFVDQFERKWNNSNPVGATETKAFAPLSPDIAALLTPADAATGLGTAVDLTWFAGPWAHLYDIHLGTDPANLRPIAVDAALGPSELAGDNQRFSLQGLNGGTTYYWRIVSKTIARKTRTSATRRFTTAGSPTVRPGLPSPWASTDIGASLTGGAEESGGTFTVRGAGDDIWGDIDQFHFAYRTLAGDGTLTARVVSQQATHASAKAGVMMRATLDGDAAHAAFLVTPTKGLAFQRRQFAGGPSTSTGGGTGAAPYWLRLVRQGNTFSAFRSPDGNAWTLVGTDTITMPSSIVVGLPVTSHASGQAGTATFDNVTLAAAGVPADTSNPSVALTQPTAGATVSGSTPVRAAASDNVGVTRVELRIDGAVLATDTGAPYEFSWNTTAVGNGDHTLEARAFDAAGNAGSSGVTTVQVSNAPAAALPPPWSHAAVGAVGAPGTASASGTTFSVTGSGADVWGTADAFHFAYQPLTGDGSIVARVATVQAVNAWTKAGVVLRESLAPGSPHGFMLVSPGKGLAFQRRTAAGGLSTSTSGGAGIAPKYVRLSRALNVVSAAVSPDGISWTTIGSDTIPMATTILVGLAVSSHVNSTAATATFDNVAVAASTAPGDTTPPAASITAPSSGATVGGTVTVAAGASDDIAVARVELWIDGALAATDTAAPYAFDWATAGVADGGHALQARAYDGAGNVGVSPTVDVVVSNAAVGLPAPWSEADIGAVNPAGSASVAGATFTVRGSGADIWDTADALHFVYQPLTGDGEIVARVASEQNVDRWTKAGVMIRESLDAGSRHALMLVSPGKGLAFQRRTSPGGLSSSTSGGAGTAPAWLRLVRTGDVIAAYRSSDGVSWTLVGTDNIPMAATIHVGLAVCSHSSGRLASATFDGVAVNTTPGTRP